MIFESNCLSPFCEIITDHQHYIISITRFFSGKLKDIESYPFHRRSDRFLVKGRVLSTLWGIAPLASILMTQVLDISLHTIILLLCRNRKISVQSFAGVTKPADHHLSTDHLSTSQVWLNLAITIFQLTAAASWSSGRVQDSGLGSRSSPEFNTLPVRLLVVPLSKALHAALLLSTQEEMGTCEGRFVSRGAKLRVSGCILPRELRWLSRRIWTVKGPMTREGTCQSLPSRALSLDVDSKQWLYL